MTDSTPPTATPPEPNATPAAAPASHALEFTALTLILAALSIAWMIWLKRPDFPLDDAYIVQHSVNGLLGGGETRFAGSTPMQGVTSPAHMLVVTLLSLAMPVGWAQALAMACAAILYVLGVFRMAIDEGAPALWAWLAALLPLLAGLSLFQFLNGLETGLAMAAVTWALVWFREPAPPGKHFAALGVLPFIRPELAALSLLLWLRALWALRSPGGLRRAAAATVWAVAGAAPFIIFLTATGGALLPNTMSAKLYFFAEGCQDFSWKISFAGTAIGLFLHGLGFAALGFVALLFFRARAVAFAFIAIFFAAYISRFPGALYHNAQRYPYLLVPLAMAGWTAWIACKQRPLHLAGRALLLIALAGAALNMNWTILTYLHGLDTSRKELDPVARWVARNLPPQAPVLIHDAGYISLCGSQPLVDLVGLKTPSSIATHKRLTWGERGIRGPSAINEIAGSNGAQYFVALNQWDKDFRLTQGLLLAGWEVDRVDGRRGDTRYRVYRLTPPWLQAAQSFPAVDMLRVYCGWPYR